MSDDKLPMTPAFANWAKGLPWWELPITRYIFMAMNRRNIPSPSAICMHEEHVLDFDNIFEHCNNPVSWAVFAGFVPDALTR